MDNDRAPVKTRADRFVVSGLVSDVRRTEMLSLEAETSETLEPFGLAPPRSRVLIEYEDEPIVLELGSKDELDYFAKVPAEPRVFVIEGSLVDAIERDPEAFWSKKPFDYRASDVTRIRVVGPDGDPQEVIREADAWPDGIEDVLYDLNSTEAEELTTTLPTGSPAYTIEVSSVVDETLSVFVGDDAIYAVRKGDDTALKLAAESWQAIEEGLRLILEM